MKIIATNANGRSLWVLVLFFLCGIDLSAQKADWEACSRYAGLDVDGLVRNMSVIPNWVGDGGLFWYERQVANGVEYVLVNSSEGKSDHFSDRESLDAALAKVTSDNAAANGAMYGAGDYPPFWQSWSPNRKYMVYACQHDLYLQEQGDSVAFRMTYDGTSDHTYSYSRTKDEEGKVRADIRWSGDSKLFYCLRKNGTNVGELWLIDALANPRPTLKTYKYPMPADSVVFTYDLHLFYPEEKRHLVVDIAKYPDQEVKILNFDFFRYPEAIYLTRKSRTYDEMDLCRVDTRTGVVEVIIHEVSKPHITDQLSECHILDGGNEFIWWSERSGWGHFYLYGKDGELKNPITRGDFVACNIVQIDTLGRSVIFQGYGREKGINPEYRQYYKANLDGTGLTLLTPGDGFHYAHFSRNHQYFVDTYSRADMPPVSELRRMDGTKIMTLEEVSPNTLSAAGWHPPTRVKVKAPDGMTDLYGVIYTPSQINPSRKYPVIAHVYPGPQDNGVPQEFELKNDNQLLAELGFIVINVETRGSCFYRGRDFHAFGYGNLRDYALADCKHTIEQLAGIYSFIDLDRVGIYGHSGGGMMAAASIFTYPDFYKVAVAASGNHDNNIYMQWWGDNYQGKGPIPTNMELAANLQGKLLLITGDYDENVHPSHTLRLADALIRNNKRFDMMVIPRAAHWLPPYYNGLVRSYFAEHLLGDSSQSADMFF